jgi:hypothetical protein
MNKVFVCVNNSMTAQLRARIQKPKAAGSFGHGKPYEQNRCLSEYMIAAWGEDISHTLITMILINYDPVAQAASPGNSIVSCGENAASS